jgi:hypothetical protein
VSITRKLQIVRNALHTGQASAVKVDGQRAFEEVEQFVNDLLAIVTLTQTTRSDIGGHFEFDVSGSGTSWCGYVGSPLVDLNGKQEQFLPFEHALRAAGASARRLLQEMVEQGGEVQ